MFFFLGLLLFSFFSFSSATCQTFGDFQSFSGTPSICSSILPSSYSVYIPPNSCFGEIEQSPSISSLTSTWWGISNPCRLALSRLQCMTYYPGCNNETANTNQTTQAPGDGLIVLPCDTICTDAQNACSSQDTYILGLYGVNLTDFNCTSSSDCTYVPLPSEVPLPQCEPYRGSLCKGVINYSVYVPAGLTQEELEAEAQGLNTLFAYAPLSQNCNKKMAAFYCEQLFMGCDDKSIGNGYPLPKYPCKSTCQSYLSSCQPFFNESSELIPPDCDAKGHGPDAAFTCNGSVINLGQDNFPSLYTIFNNYSIPPLNTTCNVISITSIASEAAAFSSCPYPLVQPEDFNLVATFVVGSCALPCPTPFSLPPSYNVLQDQLLTVGCWISFFAEFFLILTFFLFPQKSRHVYVKNFIVAAILEICSVFLGLFVWPKKGDPTWFDPSFYSVGMRCISNTMHFTRSNSHLCGFQGFVQVYAGNAINCWWALICVDVWLQVVMETRVHHRNRKIQLAFMAYAWTIGLPMAIGAITDKIDSQGFLTCDIKGPNDWYYTFGTMTVHVFISSILLIWTSIKVIQVGWRAHTLGREALRLLFFVVIFLGEYAISFALRGYSQVQTNPETAASTKWLTCLLTPGGTIQECGQYPEYLINPHFQLLVVSQICTAGIVLFIVWTDTGVYELWKFFLSSPNRCSLSKMNNWHPTTTRKGTSHASHIAMENMRGRADTSRVGAAKTVNSRDLSDTGEKSRPCDLQAIEETVPLAASGSQDNSPRGDGQLSPSSVSVGNNLENSVNQSSQLASSQVSSPLEQIADVSDENLQTEENEPYVV